MMLRAGEGRERRSGGVLLCWVTAHVVRHSATRRVAVAAARVRSLIYDSARPSIIATWASRPPLPSAIRSAAAAALALIRRRRKQSNYISVYPRRRSDNARTGR